MNPAFPIPRSAHVAQTLPFLGLRCAARREFDRDDNGVVTAWEIGQVLVKAGLPTTGRDIRKVSSCYAQHTWYQEGSCVNGCGARRRLGQVLVEAGLPGLGRHTCK